MADDERPIKRIRTSKPDHEASPVASLEVSNRDRATCEQPFSERKDQERSTVSNGKGRYAQRGLQSTNRSKSIRTFSQPSVICTGDKGIFVSSDKGREKKCLLELHDLLQQYLNEIDVDGTVTSQDREDPSTGSIKDAAAIADHAGSGIEADIASELAELRGAGPSEADRGTRLSEPMQLITLDIPCVSFLRLPPSSSVDPVEVVHQLCLSAAAPSAPQKSRFIKRLTPISRIGKALSQGLEKVCDEVLPDYFGRQQGREIESIKFAIRPTIRNNDKLDRDQVIKTVAAKIQEVGESKHKVDLKQFEKAVLVDVYRGWVGICVVDNTSTGAYQMGYEKLKRFNLAEIYANR
ncbi:hypothetical protein H2198_010478 [Neophaeococcomyces mojaviensis]|uniref:Uncharacterized protein n=1 Tax=Neophaeococcomyces mojaviensis TaxID=3383035 RepID=A0ACC2ZRJ3_9EURO|nr:hypothetical protein H2198_010478 [Knufia sp. JES_112]